MSEKLMLIEDKMQNTEDRIEHPKLKTQNSKLFLSYLLSVAFCLILLLILTVQLSHAARIKELGYINGVRTNQLIGYGLVVGLNNTGDKAATLFTNQSLANMLEKVGIKIDPTTTKVTNIAAVMVTADLPAFSKIGNKVDATVSSIGDSKGLQGGVLLITQLKGADGEVYAVAQGPLVVGGFSAAGQGASMQKNHPTVGRIVNGVSIEREIGYEYVNKTESVVISLKIPDFTNARRIEERINTIFKDSSNATDGGTINVTIPETLRSNTVKFLSIIENLEVKPDSQAKIVVDEKTGTIVIGENVRISTVGISHGNVSIQIKEDEKVSQPLPFAPLGAQTVRTPDTKMKVEEERGRFMLMEGGVTIKELIGALNNIGVSTRDVIVILQTIKAAGALHADLEII
jgi:flagellar P-ring protein FlgI